MHSSVPFPSINQQQTHNKRICTEKCKTTEYESSIIISGFQSKVSNQPHNPHHHNLETFHFQPILFTIISINKKKLPGFFLIAQTHFFHSKFVVHCSLFTFTILFCLRLDNYIGMYCETFMCETQLKKKKNIKSKSYLDWPYWAIFTPLWIWKGIATLGATIGAIVWCRYPHYRFVCVCVCCSHSPSSLKVVLTTDNNLLQIGR